MSRKKDKTYVQFKDLKTRKFEHQKSQDTLRQTRWEADTKASNRDYKRTRSEKSRDYKLKKSEFTFNILKTLFGGKGKIVFWLIYALFMLVSVLWIRPLFFATLISTIIIIVALLIIKSRDSTWKVKGLTFMIASIIVSIIVMPILPLEITPLNLSDVCQYPAGLRLQTNDWNGLPKDNYYYDRTANYETMMINDKETSVVGQFTRMTDNVMAFDFDDYQIGMPNIRLEYLRDTIPCTKDGVEIDNYLSETRIYEYWKDGKSYDLKFYETYVMSNIRLSFTADFDVADVDWSHWYVQKYFQTLTGEFNAYYNSYPEGSPLLKTTYHSRGYSAAGEIALGVHAEKIKFDEAEDLDNTAMISTAVIDVECVAKEYQYNVYYYDGPSVTLKNPPGYNGVYHVMDDSVDLLYYKSVEGALQKMDGFEGESIGSVTYSDNMFGSVYVPIDFAVYLGAVAGIPVASSISRPDMFSAVTGFSVDFNVVATVISVYQLNIDKDGKMTIIGGDDGDELTAWEKIVEWFINLVGGVESLWFGGPGGKALIISVCLLLFGSFLAMGIIRARNPPGPRDRSKAGRIRRTSSSDQPIININVGASGQTVVPKQREFVKQPQGKTRKKKRRKSGFIDWLRNEGKKKKRGRKKK